MKKKALVCASVIVVSLVTGCGVLQQGAPSPSPTITEVVTEETTQAEEVKPDAEAEEVKPDADAEVKSDAEAEETNAVVEVVTNHIAMFVPDNLTVTMIDGRGLVVASEGKYLLNFKIMDMPYEDLMKTEGGMSKGIEDAGGSDISEVKEFEQDGKKFAYISYYLEDANGMVVTTPAPDGRRISGQFTIQADVPEEELLDAFTKIALTATESDKEDSTSMDIAAQVAKNHPSMYGEEGEEKSSSSLKVDTGEIQFSVPDGFVSTFVSSRDMPENESGSFTEEFFEKKGTDFCDVTCSLTGEAGSAAKDFIDNEIVDDPSISKEIIAKESKQIGDKTVWVYGSQAVGTKDQLYTLVAMCDVGDCIFKVEMLTESADLMVFDTIEGFFK